MPRGEMKARNRRREEPELGGWWEVVMGMGMPLLYIVGIITGIVGAICMGVITEYWANLEPPRCFLYSKTASQSVVYQFGSSVAVCEWVTYGAVTGVIIAFISGIIYTCKVRTHKDLDAFSSCSMVGIILSLLMMLAATCTMAEGMRLSCAAMGLNSANNKGVTCYDKLDWRVAREYLPVESSTMVRASLICFSCSSGIFFVIACFHLSDFYRRTLRYRYG